MLFPALCTFIQRLSWEQALHLMEYGQVRSQMRAARKSAPRGLLRSPLETTTTTVLYRKRCLSFKPIHCDYSCSPTFPRVALKVLVQKELCCMYGVVVLLNKPFYIVIVAVVCFVIAVAKLSDSILNLRRISFQFGQFANFKALFPAVPKNLLRLSAFIGAIIILKFKSF